MNKPIIHLPEEDAAVVALRLHKLADEIAAGAVVVSEVYGSVNLIDTTPEDATARTCETDQTSYVFMMRFARLPVVVLPATSLPALKLNS